MGGVVFTLVREDKRNKTDKLLIGIISVLKNFYEAVGLLELVESGMHVAQDWTKITYKEFLKHKLCFVLESDKMI